VGSPNSRSIGTGHLRYDSDSYIAHYQSLPRLVRDNVDGSVRADTH